MRWMTLILLVACGGEIGITDIESDDTDAEEDLSRYEDASLRIVQPQSGTFLALGEEHTFEAELRDADGELIDTVSEVDWISSVDSAWTPTEPAFVSAELGVGLHDLTAQVVLPNGDRLAHTVGGVLVQAEVAGTYVGVVSSSFEVQGFPVSCAGSATLIVEPLGRQVLGEGTCLAAAGEFELPLEFVVDADHQEGGVDGLVQVSVIAFDIDMAAEGTLAEDDLDMDFVGQILTSELNGRLRTTRISRDAGL